MYNLNEESDYDNLDNLDNLDTSWINDFDNIDKEYKIYYCEDITFINFQFIYINRDNEIEKFKEEKLMFKEPNKIQKDELISIIKRNQMSVNVKYYLLSILKYIINIEPINLKTFLKNKASNNFLQIINNIDSIKLDKSISMFHDLNSIIVLLKQKDKRQTNKSRKAFQKLHNKTKKIT